MSKTTTKSLQKIIKKSIEKQIKQNETKIIYKKLLFKAGDNLPTYTFERLSY